MTVVHNTKVLKRPRGRPQTRPDEETRKLILKAARKEFHASGYAGASMGRVAERAGVSTKTLYRLIPTKAELFRNVISDKISGFMLEMDDHSLDALPIEEAPEHILTAYGKLTLNEDTTFTLRLVYAECDRFPELAADFVEIALRRTTDMMEAWLKRQRDRGRIEVEDTLTAVGMLRGMMMMEPQRAIMLGLSGPPDDAKIAARARFCARLFLDGCKSRRDQQRAARS